MHLPTNYSRDYIIKGAELIRREYEALKEKTVPTHLADKWIFRSSSRGIQKATDLIDAVIIFDQIDAERDVHKKHPKPISEIFSAPNWGDTHISKVVRDWRRNLNVTSYQSIPEANRKEIFDYFFRYDVHGNLNCADTVYLSRGVNDPTYFLPPAIVNVALEIASKNNWFGYSDSLGHVSTRSAIADLENVRRRQSNITFRNTAVVQGGTAGLNAVLSMVARTNKDKSCLVAAPNYAPIIDDVEHYFKPKIFPLNSDYTFNANRLLQSVDGDVAVALFSIPHNPAGFREFVEILPELQARCAEKNVYLIVDEIIFDEKISPFLDPIRYPNMILVSSHSKTYNIPGLKLGHMVANEQFVDQFYRHASTTYGSPPSFFYFTATCLALYEKASRLQSPPIVPPEILGEVSNPELLQMEFSLWSRTIEMQKRFQNYLVRSTLENARTLGIDKAMGLDDPLPNVVIRTNLEKCAYAISLDTLAKRNISVMPIECFSPASDWPSDLRVTLAVNPKNLAVYFPQFINHLDGCFAEDNLTAGLEDSDRTILNDIGLLNHVECADFRSRPFKRREALKELFNAAANEVLSPDMLKPTADILSAVTYMGIGSLWKELPYDEFEKQKSILSIKTGKNADIFFGMSIPQISMGLLELCKPWINNAVITILNNYFAELSSPEIIKSPTTELLSLADSASFVSPKILAKLSGFNDVITSYPDDQKTRQIDAVIEAIRLHGVEAPRASQPIRSPTIEPN